MNMIAKRHDKQDVESVNLEVNISDEIVKIAKNSRDSWYCEEDLVDE